VTLAVVAGFAAGLFCGNVLSPSWTTGFPPQFPDSFSYLEVAARGPLRLGFLFDERPIGYPFVLWALGRSTPVVVVFQTVLHCVALAVLGTVIYRTFRSKAVATIAIVLIAATVTQSRFTLWTTQLLTESISLSLAVLMAAAWWWSAATGRRIGWAWAATIAWLLVRDANVMPVLLVVVPAAAACALWRSTPRPVARALVYGAAATAILCAYVFAAERVSDRGRTSFHNNIGLRVLPDPELREYFAARGMPLDATLRGRTGKDSWADYARSLLDDPALEGYRRWARTDGRGVLLRSLVVHFSTWFGRLLRELPVFLPIDLEPYDTFGASKRLPRRLPAQLGGPEGNAALLVWTLLAIGGLALLAFEGGRGATVFCLGVGLASAFLDVVGSYVGDSVEVARHLVGPLARLQLFLACSVAVGLDALVGMAVRGRSAPRDRTIETAQRGPNGYSSTDTPNTCTTIR
jgi:hypothetical protein